MTRTKARLVHDVKSRTCDKTVIERKHRIRPTEQGIKQTSPAIAEQNLRLRGIILDESVSQTNSVYSC